MAQHTPSQALLVMRSKTQRIVGVCGVVAGLFLSNPAAAAPANDNITCANASGDAAIAACGRAIASRKFKGIDLAQLYYNRGVEYAAKGECDRAIADYNQSIRLDPKYVLAYNKRGDCFTRQGSNFRALEDYAKAIELDPTNSRVYFNRGDIFWKKGDFDRAISEYTEFDPNSNPKMPTPLTDAAPRIFGRANTSAP